MRLPVRRAILAALVSTTAFAAPRVPASNVARTAVGSETPSQPWPQSFSDVAPDPALRFGTLTNGMRYVIMRNATPPGQASLQMRIDAGSLMEKENQLGLAHFMEHMAFNGTAHIPQNDLVSDLQRMGLAFGADLNAGTSFDETYYQLQLPRTDDVMIDRALFILREQVSEATMKQEDINGERGVIAGEERLRNTPGLRVGQAQLALLAHGQLLPERWPIGDMKVINSAERERFVDFYNQYYRPSRATLVAVGDFDVDRMEAKVRAAYADWKPKAPDGPEPDLGAVAPRGQEAQVLVGPGLASTLSMQWTSAPDLTPDSEAKRRQDLVRKLGFKVLERRMSELSRTDDAPFVQAAAAEADTMRSLHVTKISATFVPGKWSKAMDALEQEQRRLVQYGVTEAELQREIVTLRTAYLNAARGAPTRQTRQLAAELVAAINARLVVTSPQQDLDEFEATVKGLTAADVNAAIKQSFVGNGPIVMVTSTEAVSGGEKAVLAALHESQQIALAPLPPPSVKAWPYNDFGKTGSVLARRELPELGVTIVTFANGVVLTVKPTSFAKDSISISVLSGHGDESFSPREYDVRQAAIHQLREGGLGKMTYDELSRSLAGHTLSAGFSVLDDHFMLGGGTRPSDLQLEMQVLAAHLTDPAFRSTPFEKDKQMYPALVDLSKSTPGSALVFYGSEQLAGGDKRKGPVPVETYTRWSIEPIRSDLRKLVESGPIRITMVGDVTVDQAIATTAETFGALPRATEIPIAPEGDQRHFPAPNAMPVKFTHTGPAEQALGYIAWPAPDAVHDLREARRVLLLQQVLNLRVLEIIREKLALTYSPGVSFNPSSTFSGYGTISINAQTRPEKLQAFFDATDGIIRDLRDQPITADELKRAREPVIESTKREMNGNRWWGQELLYVVDKPEYIPQIMTTVADLEKVTPADIQALARKYLVPGKAWKAIVTSDQLKDAPLKTAAR